MSIEIIYKNNIAKSYKGTSFDFSFGLKKYRLQKHIKQLIELQKEEDYEMRFLQKDKYDHPIN